MMRISFGKDSQILGRDIALTFTTEITTNVSYLTIWYGKSAEGSQYSLEVTVVSGDSI